MFYYLNGEITIKEPNHVVIDIGGVGYSVSTSFYTSSALDIGKVFRIYTYTHIREDIFDIYGFLDQEELNFFKHLISISGVGPKAALSILSISNPSALALAIITGDEKLITKASGIGKKIAQRIVLELKDKIAKEQVATPSNSSFAATDMTSNSISEAISALMVLGYTKEDATSALHLADTSLSSEELIKIGLKNLLTGC